MVPYPTSKTPWSKLVPHEPVKTPIVIDVSQSLSGESDTGTYQKLLENSLPFPYNRVKPSRYSKTRRSSSSRRRAIRIGGSPKNMKQTGNKTRRNYNKTVVSVKKHKKTNRKNRNKN